MCEHHEDGACDSKRLERGHSEEDEAHVTHRRVCNHALEIRLSQTDDCTIDQTDHAEYHQQCLEFDDLVWEERHTESEESVCTHLQHDTGQQHRARSGGLDVGIRQPSVNGYARHFRRKANEHQQEDDTAQSFGRDEIRLVGHQDEIERFPCDVSSPTRIVVEVHHKDACEHEDAGCEGIDEELLSSVSTILTTPH